MNGAAAHVRFQSSRPCRPGSRRQPREEEASTLPRLADAAVFIEGTAVTALWRAAPATADFQGKAAAVKTSTAVDDRKVQNGDNRKEMRRLLPTFGPALAVTVCLTTTACGVSPTVPSNNAPYSQTDVRLGTGVPAENGKVLTVNYSGWFYKTSAVENKGPEFDTSTGREPFSFTLGGAEVIEGWDRGLSGMRVGGVRRLVIPPSLAYGSQRFGPIPPNATLLFEIELLDVQ
jgi:FKBP-type peptidyl-prolyl cis-trans isomerase FkpA